MINQIDLQKSFVCLREDLPKIEGIVAQVDAVDKNGDVVDGFANFVREWGRGFVFCAHTPEGFVAIDLGSQFAEEYEIPEHNHTAINDGGIVTALAWFD